MTATSPSARRVAVVGGGVVGLTTAVVLAERGHTVTVVAADPPQATTSYVAAGAWHPTRVAPRERVRSWGARTFAVLHALARHDPRCGVITRRTLGVSREPDPAPPWWADAVGGVTRSPTADLPTGYAAAWEFVAPLAVMPRYLPWLVARGEAAGVRTVRRRLTSFAEAAPHGEVIVDCAGLGARELATDPDVVPVRGQLVRTTDPGLRWSVRDEDHPDGPTYVHPRGDDVVLGGTAEVGRDDLTPDPDVAAAILARCTALAPQLADARILGHAVGVRPVRPSVRHEVDPSGPPGCRLIHHYGHGGAGVTLSWGGAEAVAALVEEVIT